MRIRMVVECDHNDVGKLLSMMPSNADWHMTRAPKNSAPSPVRAAVIKAITNEQEVNKRGDRRGMVRNRQASTTTRKFILEYLLVNPESIKWSNIINAGAKQHSWTRSRTSSGIRDLIRDGKINKDENKFHHITEEGRKELAV